MRKVKKHRYTLIIITLLLGLVGLISLLLLSWANNRIDRVQNDINNIVKSTMGNDQSPITDNMDKKIKKYVDENRNIKGIRLKIRTGQYPPSKDEKIVYSYPYSIDFDKLMVKNNEKQFFMQVYDLSSTINISNSNKSIFLEALFMSVKINYLSILSTLSLITIVAYWILFTIWSALRILKNKDSVVWILLVFVSNLLGFLLYLFFKKIKLKQCRRTTKRMN